MQINTKKWFVVKIALASLALIPLIFVFIRTIQTGKDSFILFENTSTLISIPILVIYFSLYVVMFSFGIYWLINQVKKILFLKNEKDKTELLHLQNQVNPHFFFNILNNLYGLIGKDQEKAQKLVLKLSDMMRYSIYEGQKEFVTLKEEEEYLKNYIQLQTMRYHKSIEVDFDSNLENDQLKIVPLLFIILLENAFKHGVNSLRENTHIKIHFFSNRKSIVFQVENNFDTDIEIENQGGIGLKNLKRRLELVYHKKYELLITKNINLYISKLIIEL